MATVHPSRLGLVPQSSPFKGEGRYNGTDRDRSRERRTDYDHTNHRDSRREDSRERVRDRRRNYSNERRRERSRSPYDRNRGRDDDRRMIDQSERQRRSSPDYSAYRKEEPSHGAGVNGNADAKGGNASAPWHAPENMYGTRGRGRTPVGDDFFARYAPHCLRQYITLTDPICLPAGELCVPTRR